MSHPLTLDAVGEVVRLYGDGMGIKNICGRTFMRVNGKREKPSAETVRNILHASGLLKKHGGKPFPNKPKALEMPTLDALTSAVCEEIPDANPRLAAAIHIYLALLVDYSPDAVCRYHKVGISECYALRHEGQKQFSGDMDDARRVIAIARNGARNG